MQHGLVVCYSFRFPRMFWTELSVVFYLDLMTFVRIMELFYWMSVHL